MENPEINPVGPQMPAEKSQAGINLAIVILVLVIVVVGVKLLMSSVSKNKSVGEEVATSTENIVTAEEETVPEKIEGKADEKTPVASEVAPGKSQVVFSVSSPNAVFVREIFVRNPYKTGASAWIQVYDGYKEVPAGGTAEIFKVSLTAITYDMARVGFVSAADGAPNEVVKNMPITVAEQGVTAVRIDL